LNREDAKDTKEESGRRSNKYIIFYGEESKRAIAQTALNFYLVSLRMVGTVFAFVFGVLSPLVPK